MGRFSFPYLAAKRSYDDVKKKFRDGGALDKTELEGAITPNVPEISTPAPFPPLIISSTSKRHKSRQNSTADSGYGGVVGSTSNEESVVKSKEHNEPADVQLSKDQSFGIKGSLSGGSQEDIFFDAQTDFDGNPENIVVITDLAGTDCISSPELTDCSSSSTDSELSTIRIIIRPPTPTEDSPLSEGLYEGQSNPSTLSVSSIYSTNSSMKSETTDMWLNADFLMPPCPENLLDQRRQRKAREHREVKKWLVAFLNSKGAQFPTKLRQRVMEIYRIDESELAPSIISQFRADKNSDEGLPADLADALRMIDGENSDKQLLRILRAFFQSQVKEMTPMGPGRNNSNNMPRSTNKTRMHGPYPDITRTRPRPRSQNYADPSRNRSQVTRSKSFSRHLSYTIREPTPASKKNPENLIKIAKEKGSIGAKQQPGDVSKNAAQTRANRSRILKGTFAAIREAFGGKRKLKEKRKLEKNGVSKERRKGKERKGRRLGLFRKMNI